MMSNTEDQKLDFFAKEMKEAIETNASEALWSVLTGYFCFGLYFTPRGIYWAFVTLKQLRKFRDEYPGVLISPSVKVKAVAAIPIGSIPFLFWALVLYIAFTTPMQFTR